MLASKEATINIECASAKGVRIRVACAFSNKETYVSPPYIGLSRLEFFIRCCRDPLYAAA